MTHEEIATEFAEIFDDLPDELVSDDHGGGDCFAGPIIPLINMEISSANAGVAYFDEDVAWPRLWLGNRLESQAFLWLFFDQCFHGVRH